MDAFNIVVGAIGWTLIHSTWLGLLAAAAYAIPAARLRVHAPQSAYAWGLTCLLTLVVVLIALFVHEFDQVRVNADVQAIAAAYAALPVATTAAASSALTAPPASLAALIDPILPALVLLWALAVVSIGYGLVRSQLALRRLVTAGLNLPELAAPVVELAHHFGVARPIAVVSSALARVPFVIGHFSPVIVLPLTVATGMPWPQLRLILAHEIAHLRRADYLVNWLQIALEVLLFFHPAVRWLSEELRRLREACCDDMVVAFAGGRRDYTRALLSLEEFRHDAPVLAPSAVAGGLLWRVQRIAGRVPSDRSALQKIVLPALFLSLLATLLVGGLQIRPGSGTRDFRVPHADMLGERSLQFEISAGASDWQVQLPALIAPRAAGTEAAATSAARSLPTVVLPTRGMIPALTLPNRAERLDASAIAAPTLSPEAGVVLPAAAATLQPLHAVKPRFPANAHIAERTLAVELSYALDDTGQVIDIRTVDAPSNSAPFVESAQLALAQWRYAADTIDQLAGQRLRHRFVFRETASATSTGDCTMQAGSRICTVDIRPSRPLAAEGSGRRCQATTGSRLCRR